MADAQLAALQARLTAADHAGALGLATALLGRPGLAAADRFAVLMLRSRAHEGLGSLAAAIADVEAALAIDPANARACNELGILCADAGAPERAIAAFLRATALDPNYTRALNNLGKAFQETGRGADAARAFARAVKADPRYALGWANLGVSLRDLGREAEAATAFESALAVDARQTVALLGLAGLRRNQGDVDAAADLYQRALAVDPRDADAWIHLAGTLAERDDLAAAARAYDEALARDPRSLRAACGRHLTLPMIVDSETLRAQVRAGYAQGLAELATVFARRAPGLAAVALVDELRWSNFLLAYHGEDDRELQARYAATVAAAIDRVAPEWRAPLARRTRTGRRLRVGFASAFFREGTVGRYFQHWITDLPRSRFEVQVFHQQPGRDQIALALADRADRFVHCPRYRPAQLAAALRAAELDVLIYPELGMDATTFAVAALRLAPVQCAAWGHPVTTGHATIDAFFTSGPMEPEGAQAHYTERLVPLPGIGTRYARPAMPPAVARSALGLPEGGALFLCPQSLFKIMPEDDALFAAVLAAVPGSRLVVFAGRHPALTARYLARLDRACVRAGVACSERVLVLPQCAHPTYLQFNRACDAMLDTLRWSGGNTTLDALACGLPVVTLPGRFMRARQSAAMLTLAGVPELVAADRDDYVRTAAALAQDRRFRADCAARIGEGAASVFDDPAPVAALAAWLDANA